MLLAKNYFYKKTPPQKLQRPLNLTLLSVVDTKYSRMEKAK